MSTKNRIKETPNPIFANIFSILVFSILLHQKRYTYVTVILSLKGYCDEKLKS